MLTAAGAAVGSAALVATTGSAAAYADIPARIPGPKTEPVPSANAPLQLVPDAGLNYSALGALGMAGYGVTEVGEVITAINTINTLGGTSPAYPNYAQAYTDTFLSWGDKLARRAVQSVGGRDRTTAGACSLRASQYYAQALFYVLATDRPGREAQIYRSMRTSWDRFTASQHAIRLRIPYRGTVLQAWLFRPDDTDTPRPTIILTGGSDGQAPDLWGYGAAAAVQRGWNAVIYEGPGQGQLLFGQKIPFTPRWEQVVTPIVDQLCRRRDVDHRRIVLAGVSMGGNLVARAAAFEHRLAAVVCEPGVVSPWSGFPASIRGFITGNSKAAANAEWAEILASGALDAATTFLLAKRFEIFGSGWLDAVRTGRLPADIWTPAQIPQQMDVTTVAAKIRCPTLVLDYDGEQFYPGQPQQLLGLLRARKTYLKLVAADGAQLHCSPMALQHHNEVIFSWLEREL